MAVVLMGADSQGCSSKTTTGSDTSAPAATPKTETVSKPAPPPVDPAVEAAQYKAACQPIEFRALEKNPDSYKGQKYRTQGQVVQILEGDTKTDIRLNVTPPQYGSYWDDTIYVTYNGKTPALDKSIINIYGDVQGKYSYTSQANYNISLPLIEAKYIDVVTQ